MTPSAKSRTAFFRAAFPCRGGSFHLKGVGAFSSFWKKQEKVCRIVLFFPIWLPERGKTDAKSPSENELLF